jgi:hypothetical protein
VHFFRRIVGVPVISKEVLSQRTADYQKWVESFARNHNIPIEWPEKGVRKEEYVQPWLRKMVCKNAYGVYFVFKSMEQGPSFRVTSSRRSGPTGMCHRFEIELPFLGRSLRPPSLRPKSIEYRLRWVPVR